MVVSASIRLVLLHSETQKLLFLLGTAGSSTGSRSSFWFVQSWNPGRGRPICPVTLYPSSHWLRPWPDRTHCASTSCSRPRVSGNRKFLPGDARQCDGWWKVCRAVSLWLTEGVWTQHTTEIPPRWVDCPFKAAEGPQDRKREIQQEVAATWWF